METDADKEYKRMMEEQYRKRNELVKKSYEQAGVDHYFTGNETVDESLRRVHPGMIIYYALHDYCTACLKSDEWQNPDFCRKEALKVIHYNVDKKWGDNLRARLGEYIERYAEEFTIPSHGATYRVVDNMLHCIVIIALLRVMYDDSVASQLEEKDAEELKAHMAEVAGEMSEDTTVAEQTYNEVVDSTVSINEVSSGGYESAVHLFAKMSLSPVAKMQDDYIFFLKKNYMIDCGDERLLELLNVTYSGDAKR